MTEVLTLYLPFGKSYFVKTPVFIFTDIKHINGHTKTYIFLEGVPRLVDKDTL